MALEGMSRRPTVALQTGTTVLAEHNAITPLRLVTNTGTSRSTPFPK